VFSRSDVVQNRSPFSGGPWFGATSEEEGSGRFEPACRSDDELRKAGVKLGDKNVVSNCIAHEFSIILRAKHLHDPVLMERNRFG
jgi:hypothetical protein